MLESSKERKFYMKRVIFSCNCWNLFIESLLIWKISHIDLLCGNIPLFLIISFTKRCSYKKLDFLKVAPKRRQTIDGERLSARTLC